MTFKLIAILFAPVVTTAATILWAIFVSGDLTEPIRSGAAEYIRDIRTW